MKMSKLTEKKKIEEIAKNFLKNQKSYKNINLIAEVNKNKIDKNHTKINKDESNIINNQEETFKDSLYISTINNQNHSSNQEINQEKKNDSNYNKYVKNSKQNKPNDSIKFYSTVNNSFGDYYYCCKKNPETKKSQIDDENVANNLNNLNNNIINNIENNNNYEIIENSSQDKIGKNKYNEKCKNIENNNSYFNLFNFNSDNKEIDENNLNIFNKVIIIYKEIKNDFSNNSIKTKNNHFKSQLMATDFFKFLFSDNLLLFSKYFNFSIDVNKFIFYQIFFFLTIIYIDENSEINEFSEMAYRTILLYSSQNFELLLNIINKKINPSEPKVYKSIISRNKIIVSILKTILPKKISNKNTHNNFNNIEQNFLNDGDLLSFHLLDEIETETKSNKTNAIKNNIYNKLIKLLSNLKKNQRLINKIKQIEKKNEIENMIKENNKNVDEQKNNNILPKFDDDKYRYSIFIDLDETLVHYYEKETNYYVKVRCGADDFIKSMSEFCEIIIVSSSGKEYTDIIINNFNKDNNYVSHTIYKESFDEDNNQLDLSKVNRDIKKCIFISHTDEFFNAPKDNILKVSEFLGEENDKEIVYLHTELMKLSINNYDDVKNILKDIKMQKEGKE